MTKDVSIILVNYKTKDLAKQCIESIYEKTHDVNFDIYVVDNGSDDGIEELLKQEFSRVKFLQSNENKGFGAGNNIALRVFDSKYAFLLNTDTILINNAVKILFDFMEANPKTGACGGNLYDEQGQNIHSYGNIFDLMDLFLKTFNLRYFFPKRHRKMKDGGCNSKNELKSVDFITGADLMLRKEALDRAGLFDERFFMYSEEAELQYRIKKSGYDIFINPEAKILHLHNKSPKKREKMYFEFLKSKYLLFRLCYGSKSNLWFIKMLLYISCINKIFSHREAICSLFDFIRKDKIEVN